MWAVLSRSAITLIDRQSRIDCFALAPDYREWIRRELTGSQDVQERPDGTRNRKSIEPSALSRASWNSRWKHWICRRRCLAGNSEPELLYRISFRYFPQWRSFVNLIQSPDSTDSTGRKEIFRTNEKSNRLRPNKYLKLTEWYFLT